MVNKKIAGIMCTACFIAGGSAALATVLPDWCGHEVQVYFDVLSREMEGRHFIQLPDLTDWKIYYKGILYIIRYFMMRCGCLVALIYLCFKKKSSVAALVMGIMESVLYTVFGIMLFTACTRAAFSVWFLIGLLPESIIIRCIYCLFRELWCSEEIRFNGKLIKQASLYSLSPYFHCKILICLVICCLCEGLCYQICA